MPDLTELQGNLDTLADNLLPDDDDLTSELSKEDEFRTHAYVVLACAVFEEFIETSFTEFVNAAGKDEPSGFSGVFVCLAVTYADTVSGAAGGGGRMPPSADMAKQLVGLYDRKTVFPNNGIKADNLANLAKPLGLSKALQEDCEPLLTAGDALGSQRGKAAHVGSVAQIRPANARQLVDDVFGQMHLLIDLLDRSA